MRLEDELKELIICELQIKDISPNALEDDTLLFEKEGLGLDSLDAIELVVLMKKHYRLEIKNRNVARGVLVSVKTMADYIRSQQKI